MPRVFSSASFVMKLKSKHLGNEHVALMKMASRTRRL